MLIVSQQRDDSMLTFEAAPTQGAAGITQKLVVSEDWSGGR